MEEKRTIHQHIDSDKKELDSGSISSQRRRHLESELESLKIYNEHHPNEDRDPSPLELFCDQNPNALECRVYDD